MPHQYERVPLSDDSTQGHSHSLPSTAPPSFRSIAPTPSLPHRNDENAATIMPPSSRPSPQDEDGISLWGSSESSGDSEQRSMRERNLEAALVSCLDRIAALEARLDASSSGLMAKDEVDLESLRKNEQKEKRGAILSVVCTVYLLFLVGFAWWVLALVRAKHGKSD